VNRTYDFSPATVDVCSYGGFAAELAVRTCRSAPGAGARTGGAPGFLHFLTNNLRRDIEGRFRTTHENTLFGFSGGGTFCVYSLLANPEGFSGYICASSDPAAQDGALFRMERQYAASHHDMRAKLFLSAGEEELTDPHVAAYGLVSGTSRLAEVLSTRNYPSLDLHARIIPGEVHDTSGAAAAMHWGLTALWGHGDY
jgi:predicted alpha/beta superfamily hydrolase